MPVEHFFSFFQNAANSIRVGGCMRPECEELGGGEHTWALAVVWIQTETVTPFLGHGKAKEGGPSHISWQLILKEKWSEDSGREKHIILR